MHSKRHLGSPFCSRDQIKEIVDMFRLFLSSVSPKLQSHPASNKLDDGQLVELA